MPFEVKKLYSVGELSYTFRISINAVNAQCHFSTYRKRAIVERDADGTSWRVPELGAQLASVRDGADRAGGSGIASRVHGRPA